MLKELKTQHRTIIQMVFSGFSNNEIAERLEMSPSSVSQIVRSPLGEAYLNGLNDRAQEDTLDVRKKLTSLNKSALATFERILTPTEKAPHAVQATVARDILDRNGYKPPDKLNIDMALVTRTDAEIDAEIEALEYSLKKTALQDPIKESAETEKPLSESNTFPETNTFPENNSSAEVSENILPAIIEATLDSKQKQQDDLSEDSDFSTEIDEKLLDKVPTDVFDSSSKAS